MFTLTVDGDIELAMPLDRYARAVFELIDSERARFARWLPGLPVSAQEQASAFRRRRESIAAGTYYSFVIMVRGELAGTIGLGPLTESTAELGYLLGSRFEGRGIVTRSLTAVIERAITELGVHRFEIYCDPRNQRSRAIARRLGFRYEGTLREAARIGGGYEDQELHALLATDWRSPAPAGALSPAAPPAASTGDGPASPSPA